MAAEFEKCIRCGGTTHWRGDVEKGATATSEFPYQKCRDRDAERTAERHARFERAYMAALGGYCSRPYYDAPDGQRQELNPSRCARIDALETVRQWDANP